MNPLPTYLECLRLPYLTENYDALAKQAAEKKWPYADYLQRLLEETRLHRLRSGPGNHP